VHHACRQGGRSVRGSGRDVPRRRCRGVCNPWPGASVLSAAAGQSSRRQLLQLSTPRRRRLPFTCWLRRQGELTRVNACPYTPHLTSGRPRVCGPADYLVKARQLGARGERTGTLCRRPHMTLHVPLALIHWRNYRYGILREICRFGVFQSPAYVRRWCTSTQTANATRRAPTTIIELASSVVTQRSLG
jgi:hypothetical protein